MSQFQNPSLSKSSSRSSNGLLGIASSYSSKKPSKALKRTQKWVIMQQIDGAQVVGQDRRIASAHRSAVYSMLDETTTMIPTIDTDFATEVVAAYDQEIEIDDEDE